MKYYQSLKNYLVSVKFHLTQRTGNRLFGVFLTKLTFVVA